MAINSSPSPTPEPEPIKHNYDQDALNALEGQKTRDQVDIKKMVETHLSELKNTIAAGITKDTAIQLLESQLDHPDGALGANSARTVLATQVALKEMGFHPDMHGFLSKKTQIEVKDFQSAWNESHPEDLLTIDGIPGTQTVTRVIRILEGEPLHPEEKIDSIDQVATPTEAVAALHPKVNVDTTDTIVFNTKGDTDEKAPTPKDAPPDESEVVFLIDEDNPTDQIASPAEAVETAPANTMTLDKIFAAIEEEVLNKSDEALKWGDTGNFKLEGDIYIRFGGTRNKDVKIIEADGHTEEEMKAIFELAKANLRHFELKINMHAIGKEYPSLNLSKLADAFKDHPDYKIDEVKKDSTGITLSFYKETWGIDDIAFKIKAKTDGTYTLYKDKHQETFTSLGELKAEAFKEKNPPIKIAPKPEPATPTEQKEEAELKNKDDITFPQIRDSFLKATQNEDVDWENFFGNNVNSDLFYLEEGKLKVDLLSAKLIDQGILSGSWDLNPMGNDAPILDLSEYTKDAQDEILYKVRRMVPQLRAAKRIQEISTLKPRNEGYPDPLKFAELFNETHKLEIMIDEHQINYQGTSDKKETRLSITHNGHFIAGLYLNKNGEYMVSPSDSLNNNYSGKIPEKLEFTKDKKAVQAKMLELDRFVS